MPDLDVFKNRWTITATIELETSLRIGGGQNAAAYSISASPILQTYNSKTKQYEPYIPGSSLKGILRSTMERLIRTFNADESCISVKDRGKPCGKPTCYSCNIFGSMDSGAKIRVRDAHITEETRVNYGLIKEQPHCATKYDKNFNIKTKNQFRGNRKISRPDIFLRVEETVTAGTSFKLHIDVDNAKDPEIGLLILSIDEFNKKRAHIGGATTRGNGFVEIKNLHIVKKELNTQQFNILQTTCDPAKLRATGKKYFKNIDSGEDSKERGFDSYYNAHKPRDLNGHIVAQIEITTLTDFKMPGVEEETVTSGGYPIIPGSTIKGYLRHKMIEKKVDAEIIKEIFGYTDKSSHKGRLIISDAYSDELTDTNIIPRDTRLKMWIVFDNMTQEEIRHIDKFIQMEKNTITGNTSAQLNKKTRESKYNQIEMVYKNLDVFRTKDYLEGIL